MRRSSWYGLVVLAAVVVTRYAGATSQEASGEPMHVGVLALDGVYNSEFIAPWDIFHHTVFHADPGMRVFSVGRTTDPVKTFEGMSIAVDYDLDSAPRIDVLVVPSAEHNMDSDLEDERLIKWVAERGLAATHVMSICDGAFVLAEAGLLDGRRCTTFPGDIAPFRKRYPDLEVVDGVSFVADGPMITGVGGARSYDPAMFLIEQVYGRKVADGVAGGMVIDWDSESVRRLVMPAETPSCYLPGDQVFPGVFVEDAAGERITLESIVAAQPDTKAVVLCVLAGAEAEPVAGRGGVWCEDTFSELANMRFLHMQYAPKGVLFVAVLCPPIFHEARFGYDEGAFRAAADDSETYRRNRALFVEKCLALEDTGQLPFDVIAFDPRFRLLAGPDAGTGFDHMPWEGKLKWYEDDQMYGTPTTWILTADGTIPGPPFWKNVYESEGRKLRYTPRDVASMLNRVLAD